MKIIPQTLPVFLFSLLVGSCTKDTIKRIDQPIDFARTAQIKYFNYGVNAPSVNFYADSVKVTAATSATGLESPTGIASGGIYPFINYTVIKGGNYTSSAVIPVNALADPGVVVNRTPIVLLDGKQYSYYLCGLYDKTLKKTEAFYLPDPIPAIDTSVAFVRFVNAVPNGLSSFTLYLKDVNKKLETPIGKSIDYKTGTDFTKVPVGIYELYARYPAAPTVNVIVRNGTTNGTPSFTGGNVYTVTARGDATVRIASSPSRLILETTANR